MCRPEGQSSDQTSSKHREVQLTRSATLARDASKRLRRAADPSDVPGRAAAGGGRACFFGCLARVRPGEEHLHATDGGGVSKLRANHAPMFQGWL